MNRKFNSVREPIVTRHNIRPVTGLGRNSNYFNKT
jgi:hypothetical protein